MDGVATLKNTWAAKLLFFKLETKYVSIKMELKDALFWAGRLWFEFLGWFEGQLVPSCVYIDFNLYA